jgi:HSP20 family protein
MSQTLSVKSREGRELQRPARVLRPRVDLVEREREWTLLADLPGVTSEAISIQTEKGKLVLRAERAQLPEPPEDGRWLVRERPLGRYEAVFELGEGIDSAAIGAELKNGVLVVHLPKTERVQPRKVEVRAG